MADYIPNASARAMNSSEVRREEEMLFIFVKSRRRAERTFRNSVKSGQHTSSQSAEVQSEEYAADIHAIDLAIKKLR